MFFRRRKAVPLSDYAPILRAALTDAVELAGFSQESCLIFISQPESTERREEGHAASFKILEKAAPLYATYKKMEAMKPEYKSARWVHHFAQRMFKYESGTAEAIAYQMQALIANDEALFAKFAKVGELWTNRVEFHAGKLLEALDILKKSDPDLYAAFALPRDLLGSIFVLTSEKSYPHGSLRVQ